MTRERKLTGWHVLAIFVGAFGIIISVNLTLAFNAVSTFPGLEVKNSYIASQTFDDRRAAQEALGWDVQGFIEADRLVLSITDPDGRPVQAGSLQAKVGRPTSTAQDLTPEWAYNGKAYIAYEVLEAGNWDLWLEAKALDGTPFQQRLTMKVAR
jgi:nitrogen fixation protein FixH